MSQEQAKAFIEKMKSDAAFRERVMAIEEVDARMAFINGEGFSCTVDEIKLVQSTLMDVDMLRVPCPTFCEKDVW